MRQDGVRRIDPQFANGTVSFADGFPVLVANEESIREVAERVGQRPDARRFRPNIVVSGAPPFDEDDLPGILNFLIFEPKQKELEMLMN